MTTHANVLLVATAKVEAQAVLKVFREATGKEASREMISDRVFHNLGVVNGVRVFIVQSQMGTGGPGGSQETVRKGIEALSPVAVIMVGIAFGINEKEQAIGDVLVSERLMLYDLQRVSTDAKGRVNIIPRGDRPRASTALYSLLQSADLCQVDEGDGEGQAPKALKVRFGLVLSGDKLVDSIDFRDQLLKFEQEAIGGEMEGAGLYTACHDRVPWILVKAICDWADGNKGVAKKERQAIAARNAAQFVLHTLQVVELKLEQRSTPPSPAPTTACRRCATRSETSWTTPDAGTSGWP